MLFLLCKTHLRSIFILFEAPFYFLSFFFFICYTLYPSTLLCVMSTQPTFQRKHLNELYSTLINGETSSVQGNKPLADYTSSSLNLASERPTGSKQPRPFSEILKRESFISPESNDINN